MIQEMTFTTQNLARPGKNSLTKHNYSMDMLNLQINPATKWTAGMLPEVRRTPLENACGAALNLEEFSEKPGLSSPGGYINVGSKNTFLRQDWRIPFATIGAGIP